jgi:DNA polymerase I-like protein with 3'-5' exonuclease and polymerase domains
MRQPFAFDTETRLIAPETPWPEVVCLQVATDPTAPALVARADGPGEVEALWNAALDDDSLDLVAHQSDYDLGVLSELDPGTIPKIFRALDQDRIKDTKLLEQLKSIEDGSFQRRRSYNGGFSLATLVRDRLGIQLDKGEDGWRLRYAELIDIPSWQWPERARAYALQDASQTLAVYQQQTSRGYQPPDLGLQVQSQWALSLMKRHGVEIDVRALDAFELQILERMETIQAQLVASGLVRDDKKRSRDMKLIREKIADAYRSAGVEPPRTDPSDKHPEGQIQTGADALEPIEGIDDDLDLLTGYLKDEKVLSTFVKALRIGEQHLIHAAWNVLVESGRTSCAAPNWQNPPRAEGVRECVRARKGRVFVLADYEVAELRALAQVCFTWFGESKLREAFCAGRDPHWELAAAIKGVSYEEMMARKKSKDPTIVGLVDGKEATIAEMAAQDRQFAKIPNFGFPGGLGARSFQSYAKGYGYKIDEAKAKHLRDQWLEQWPEMRQYFGVIASITAEGGPKAITQFGSNRVRGGMRYTQAANTPFQGYVADVAKRAHYLITRACYVRGFDDRLYGARPLFFIHDEIITECDEGAEHDVAQAKKEIMEAVQAEWMPDVPPAVEVKASRVWAKKAKPVIGPDDRLTVWEYNNGPPK